MQINSVFHTPVKTSTENDSEDTAEDGTNTSTEPWSRLKHIAALQGDEQRKACMLKLNDD